MPRYPISASKLEASRIGLRLLYMTYVDKPKVQQNAEFAAGDSLHKTLAYAGAMRFRNEYSFKGDFLRRFREMQEVNFDKGKYGIWFPRADRGAEFYERAIGDYLSGYFRRNKSKMERWLSEREAADNAVEEEVISEYCSQQRLSMSRGRGASDYLRLTKKEIRRDTAGVIREMKRERRKGLWPRKEQRIVFDFNGTSLITIPDMLIREGDGVIYLDHKIHYDLVRHQFTMAKEGIRKEYGTEKIRLIKNHILDRHGKYGGLEEVIITGEDIGELERDIDRMASLFDDINRALGILRKARKDRERDGQRSFGFDGADERWAKQVLDPHGFPRCDGCGSESVLDFPAICNYRKRCDNLDSGEEVSDIKMIIDDYWYNVTDIWQEEGDEENLPR